MFQGFSDETFEFFMAIRFNNNVDFFHDNHDWYLRAVRTPCLELAAALSDAVEAIDDDMERRPNRVVSRINRDIRFSHDKSPYRDYMWLSYRNTAGPKGATPGLYFDISAEGANCGMGFYDDNRPLMNGLRRELLARPEAFLSLLEPLRTDFKPYLRSFKRMKLPEGLHPDLREWYPVRSFYLEHAIADFNLIKSPALAEEVARGFSKLAPLYRYITALQPEADEDQTRVRPDIS